MDPINTIQHAFSNDRIFGRKLIMAAIAPNIATDVPGKGRCQLTQTEVTAPMAANASADHLLFQIRSSLRSQGTMPEMLSPGTSSHQSLYEVVGEGTGNHRRRRFLTLPVTMEPSRSAVYCLRGYAAHDRTFAADDVQLAADRAIPCSRCRGESSRMLPQARQAPLHDEQDGTARRQPEGFQLR